MKNLSVQIGCFAAIGLCGSGSFNSLSVCHASTQAVKRQYHGIRPVHGWVYNAELTSFLSEKWIKPCRLLREYKFAEAAPIFKKEYASHPDELGAYIGYVQADHSEWPVILERLRTETSDPNRDFKLGAIYWYQWCSGNNPSDMVAVAKAQNHLGLAWLKTHEPIAGLMYLETTDIGVHASEPAVKKIDVNTLFDKIFEVVIGPKAFGQYLDDKNAEWNASIPKVDLIPKENRELALGMVECLRSQSTSRWAVSQPTSSASDKPQFTWQPYSAYQKNMQVYMKEWYDALIESLRESP